MSIQATSSSTSVHLDHLMLYFFFLFVFVYFGFLLWNKWDPFPFNCTCVFSLPPSAIRSPSHSSKLHPSFGSSAFHPTTHFLLWKIPTPDRKSLARGPPILSVGHFLLAVREWADHHHHSCGIPSPWRTFLSSQGTVGCPCSHEWGP